jgi:hypothetical protein
MILREIPLCGDLEEFCIFMGYPFVKTYLGLNYYNVPAKHICKLRVYTNLWKKGLFDKDSFLNK